MENAIRALWLWGRVRRRLLPAGAGLPGPPPPPHRAASATRRGRRCRLRCDTTAAEAAAGVAWGRIDWGGDGLRYVEAGKR